MTAAVPTDARTRIVQFGPLRIGRSFERLSAPRVGWTTCSRARGPDA